jgi:hypothetical protein
MIPERKSVTLLFKVATGNLIKTLLYRGLILSSFSENITILESPKITFSQMS